VKRRRASARPVLCDGGLTEDDEASGQPAQLQLSPTVPSQSSSTALHDSGGAAPQRPQAFNVPLSTVPSQSLSMPSQASMLGVPMDPTHVEDYASPLHWVHPGAAHAPKPATHGSPTP
jgi:hypothetical protein